MTPVITLGIVATVLESDYRNLNDGLLATNQVPLIQDTDAGLPNSLRRSPVLRSAFAIVLMLARPDSDPQHFIRLVTMQRARLETHESILGKSSVYISHN